MKSYREWSLYQESSKYKADLDLIGRRLPFGQLAAVMNSDVVLEKKLVTLDEQKASLEAELRLLEVMRAHQLSQNT